MYIHCAVLEVPTPLSVVYRSDGPLENGIIAYQHVLNLPLSSTKCMYTITSL